MGAFTQALGQVATTAAGQATGGVLSKALGMIFAKSEDRRQRKQQDKLNRLAEQSTNRLQDEAYKREYDMWQKTGPTGQMEQLEKAGLNPGLIYGMGGAGGQTIGSSGPSVGAAAAPSGKPASGSELQLGINPLTMAQARVLEAQARNLDADTAKKSGVDTELSKSQTANNILDGIIKDYTGKQAKDQYEIVDKPNRYVESKTKTDELGSRQAIANTIYDMWVDGRLEDKATAEVEQILLNNAKTRAEKSEIYKRMDLLDENIKGQKLENIIKELETKLQTQTGIDRSSPYWLKMVGRLLINLIGD